MDRSKKTIPQRAVIAAAAVLLLTVIMALPAAEKTDRAYLGVTVQGLNNAACEKLGITYGVEVASIEKESAAAKAGIAEGDVIQLANGEKIRHAQDLVDVISELAPGTTVKIGLWRNGKTLEVSATLGRQERKEKFVWHGKDLPRVLRSGAYLGVVLQELNDDLAPYFKVKAGEGVLIIRVEKDSPAEKAGLKAGDVVVQLAEKKIGNADALHEALADLKKGDTAAITVIRHGKKETLKAEPDFSRRQRILRFFNSGAGPREMKVEIPDLDIEVPAPPDMSHIEEALQRVHEKLDRVKLKINKRLDHISESFWI